MTQVVKYIGLDVHNDLRRNVLWEPQLATPLCSRRVRHPPQTETHC